MWNLQKNKVKLIVTEERMVVIRSGIWGNVEMFAKSAKFQ
jgi:hypothetical protein